MKDVQQTVDSLIDGFNDTALYDIATSILYHLEHKGYSIWQTYTKEDIAVNMGREPTADEMDEMQERLADCFEYIRPEGV